jgi:UbiD family decarboxylase
MGFMDLREWMHVLEKTGELRRVMAEVDWDREIGAIARRVLEKKGPALLFENIKGYGGGRCTKLFVNGFGSRARLALALGFPPDATNRDFVQHVMRKNREAIAPVVTLTGPVKDVIIRGDAIDQTEFPVPKWHYLEGGRYIHTFSAIVTRDPDTRMMNVGVYRGMIGRKDTTPFLLIKGGRLPQRAVAARALRDRRSRGAGRRGDRHRGDHQRRSGDLRARRAVRGIHRLCVGPADAAPGHEDHLHHPPPRSSLPRHA